MIVALLAILLLFLEDFGQATPCYPGSTWPRLIGYGKSETEVIGIDRRASDGALALHIMTSEADLNANAGNFNTARIYSVFDTATDSYTWLKVVQNHRPNTYSFIYFSPDGTKVLASYIDDAHSLSVIYFDATTGQ